MTAPTEPLLRYLRRLTARSDKDASDAVLLQRFVSQNDEAAFTTLLARHGPMVFAVCRRILRDGHDAEEAFQATFLVLARKAGRLRHPEGVASWLYGTARHLASSTRRAESRRRQREARCSQSVTLQGDLLDDLSARELLLALDEELARLPETYRLPLILCYLEGRTVEEAARLLGWTAGSVKGRLERGRKRLHARLTRRGLELSGALLALVGLREGSACAAARLTSTTLQAALAFGRGECGGIAATVVGLAETGLANMTMAKAKMGLVLLLAIGLTAGASALVYSERPSTPAEAKRASTPQAPAEKKIVVDRYGDPLPPGALTRLGTIRLRHGGHVMAVTFAPDGKTMVSGGYDGYAFLWDVATGKRLRAFRQDAIDSVAIDPKGKTVALASSSKGAVKLYELATGKKLAAFLPGHPSGTEIVVFSPDGKLLAACGTSKNNAICLWTVSDGRELRSWQADRVYGPSLRFTPDGKSLAYLDEDGALRLREVATGADRAAPGPLASVRTFSFCFAADGKVLVTGGSTTDGLLQLWDAGSGKEIRTIAETKRKNTGVVLTPDGKTVWTTGDEDDLRQWDRATGKQLLHIPHACDRMHCFDLSADGKRIAVGDHAGSVFLWDTETGQKALDFDGHRSMVTGVAFSPDGRQVWTGGQDHTIRQWAMASGEQVRRFSTERDNDDLYSLALRPDGKMLAVAVLRRTISPWTEKCDVRLWDLATNTERPPLRGHGGWVNAVAFSPDGRTLASRSDDRTLRLWDVATGKERHRLRCSWRMPRGLFFSADGSRVISLLDKETVGFWDVDNERLVRKLQVGPSLVPLLSRNGRMLIAGGDNQPLRIWEIASGKERCRFDNKDSKGYFEVALSPDDRLMAFWPGYDRAIQLWNLMTGESLGKFDVAALPASPLHMTFSPDSRSLATALNDGTTVIWDAAALSPPSAAETKLSPQRLEELWNELASEDAVKAYRAVRTLAATPRQSLPLLGQRLAEAAKAKVDPAKIARLLSELDSVEFAVREKASGALRQLGMSAEAAMREALSQRPSLEVRRRLEQMLEKLEAGAKPVEQLRILRAVEVLELIGSAEALQVLHQLKRGTAEEWMTQEVGAALKRLTERAGVRP